MLSKSKASGPRAAILTHFGLFSSHLSLALEVALVANQDDHHVMPGVHFQICQPPVDSYKASAGGDVVYKQRAHGAAVIRAGDSSVTLLACGVPYLDFDESATNVH